MLHNFYVNKGSGRVTYIMTRKYRSRAKPVVLLCNVEFVHSFSVEFAHSFRFLRLSLEKYLSFLLSAEIPDLSQRHSILIAIEEV